MREEDDSQKKHVDALGIRIVVGWAPLGHASSRGSGRRKRKDPPVDFKRFRFFNTFFANDIFFNTCLQLLSLFTPR